MNRWVQIAIFGIIATLSFCVGWSQSLGRYVFPPHSLALWFPWASIAFHVSRETRVWVAAGLIQYPVLTAAFAIGIHLWRTSRVLATILAVHLSCIGIASLLVQREPAPNHAMERTADRP